MTGTTAPSTPTAHAGRTRAWWEIGIVLGLSVGASAVYAIIAIIARATSDTALADQSTSLNTSQSDRSWLDLSYQLIGVAVDLVPVALALYLLWLPGRSAFSRIGLDRSRPGRDLGSGVLLFLCIGIPGLAFYVLGRVLGITVAVEASALDSHWWTVPVLLLSALRAALVEEVIVVGYLFTRLRELSWGPWAIVVSAAVLRGSYHLYQGYGPFIGNVAMGLLFGWVYLRVGRVAPLVVTHFLLDAVSFVGYPLAAAWWPQFFTAG